VHPTAWVADSAEVIGRVTLGENASVWYGAVLRGDNDRITVGANSNVQDGSVLHTDHGVPLTIGQNVTIGHQVMLHGCTIGDGSWWASRASCSTARRSAATAWWAPARWSPRARNSPTASLIVGRPAKVVRELTPEQIAACGQRRALCAPAAAHARQRKRIGCSLPPAAHDELHKFLFEGLPVRGMLVRLTDSWREVLRRRQASDGGAFPAPVRTLLGEMAAAGVLMQANIKFNGALILQMQGDGPVKLAVAEVQPDLSFRVPRPRWWARCPRCAQLEAMLNVHGQGRCAITLDPQGPPARPAALPGRGAAARRPARAAAAAERGAGALHAAERAARHPPGAGRQRRRGRRPADPAPAGRGRANLAGEVLVSADEDQIGRNEDYNRIALLAGTLTPRNC
jgi:carbonic anhydrase/acetyltransferase-like protein (isoleucine patch superfamily)